MLLLLLQITIASSQTDGVVLNGPYCLMPYQYNFPCTSVSQCGHGMCSVNANNVTEYFCSCERGYRSVDGNVCSKKLQEKGLAVFISFLVGILGADWFFLSKGNRDYILIGFIKLYVTLANLFVLPHAATDYEYTMRTCLFAGFVWWLVDWIRIVSGSFSSGDGFPLADC